MAQTADAPDAQARIDHRRLVGAHPARSRKMMARAGTLPDVRHQHRVVAIERRIAAVREIGRHRRRTHDRTKPLHTREDETAVFFGAGIAGIDKRGRARLWAGETDRAAARGAEWIGR